MTGISKISGSSGITHIQNPASGDVKKAVVDNNNWEKNLKSFADPVPTDVKSIQVKLERAPTNVTNQNAMLTPKQMADLLSKELARRTAQSKATKAGSRAEFQGDISKILDENDDLSRMLENASPEAILEFLASFQASMEKHLEGMEFGNVVYDYAAIEMLMAKY